MTAPPGWYADPSAPRTLRWWDGTAWTAHTAPVYGPDPVRDVSGESGAGHYARMAMLVAPVLWIGYYFTIALVLGDTLRRLRHDFHLIADPNRPNSFSASFGGVLVIDLFGLLLLAAQILFVVWLYKAAEVGERAGIPARRSPGWAIAGFVVPIVNFWFPYQSAADLFPAGHPDRRLAGRWWTWYLVQSGLALPLMITTFFSAVAAVVLAVVFGVAPVLAGLAARRLITGANAAHAQLLLSPSSAPRSRT